MPAAQQRIVVGIDGSGQSRAALRWALRQARLTGAVVDMVAVWRYPVAYSLAVVGGDLGLEDEARTIWNTEATEEARRPRRALLCALCVGAPCPL